MRRREFITLLGGAAAAWPLAARAQQPAMPVIGFLRNTPSAPFVHIVTAFRRGLNEVGFVEGQNVAIEQRWAEGQDDRLPALVAELVRQKAAVIVANNPGALAAKAAATTIPIVFATGSDPVRDGLVASLNRPGGNVTGVVFITSVLGAKRLELLRQLVPKATTIAMLVRPDTTETEAERIDVQNAAQALGQELVLFDVTSGRDIEAAFATFVERRPGGLLVGTGPFLTSNRERVVALAARHGVPAIYPLREYASAGGVMSYGVGQDREEANRLQQVKWELTSRIRDESNVPNAFHFSGRSPLSRGSGPTVPDEVLTTTGLGGSAHQMSASVFHPS
jgi:putative tryptophan/tyrosine transport system substrate-binding protein